MSLRAIRARRPLVHCLTNGVTVGRVADVLAALGALPVMASAPEEAAEMVAHAQALLLNLGTPSEARWRAAGVAGRRARELGIPVVVDAVGCGSTAWRTDRARALVAEVRPNVVQGNAPEIAALAGLTYERATLRGVTAIADGAAVGDELVSLVEAASRVLGGAVVLATGQCDALSNGERTLLQGTDVPVLASVVGGGDVLGAVVAACCAVEPEPLEAAWAGLLLFTETARLAGAGSAGPGSFWPRFLDALATPAPESPARTGAARGVSG